MKKQFLFGVLLSFLLGNPSFATETPKLKYQASAISNASYRLSVQLLKTASVDPSIEKKFEELAKFSVTERVIPAKKLEKTLIGSAYSAGGWGLGLLIGNLASHYSRHNATMVMLVPIISMGAGEILSLISLGQSSSAKDISLNRSIKEVLLQNQKINALFDSITKEALRFFQIPNTRAHIVKNAILEEAILASIKNGVHNENITLTYAELKAALLKARTYNGQPILDKGDVELIESFLHRAYVAGYVSEKRASQTVTPEHLEDLVSNLKLMISIGQELLKSTGPNANLQVALDEAQTALEDVLFLN